MAFGKKAKDKHYAMEQDGKGEAATAMVLTSKASGGGMSAGGESGDSLPVREQRYSLTVRVTRDGADPYEADVTYKGLGLRQPQEGETVPVRFDPDDPPFVVLDVAKIQGDSWLARHPEDGPDPEKIKQLEALQLRFDKGELPEGQFRVERAKILGG